MITSEDVSKYFPSGSCNSFREWCYLAACIQVLIGNNMRISHINNTSQMFTMAGIDFFPTNINYLLNTVFLKNIIDYPILKT